MIKAQCLSRGATRRAWLFFGILMACAALGFVFMNFKSGLLPQIVFIFSLIGAVYVLVRYVTNAYLYQIVDEGEDGIFFLAVRVNGKKRLTQCKLPLSALSVIGKEGEQTPPKIPVSNFSPILLSEEDTLLYFEAEKAILRVSLDQAFVDALCAFAPTAATAFAPTPVDGEPTSKTPRGPYDLSDLENGQNSGKNG